MQTIRGYNKRETEHQYVLCLNTKLKTIFKKVGKINRKTFWVECYSLKRYVSCVLPRRKNSLPLRIDTFAPSSYKHRVV